MQFRSNSLWKRGHSSDCPELRPDEEASLLQVQVKDQLGSVDLSPACAIRQHYPQVAAMARLGATSNVAGHPGREGASRGEPPTSHADPAPAPTRLPHFSTGARNSKPKKPQSPKTQTKAPKLKQPPNTPDLNPKPSINPKSTPYTPDLTAQTIPEPVKPEPQKIQKLTPKLPFIGFY